MVSDRRPGPLPTLLAAPSVAPPRPFSARLWSLSLPLPANLCLLLLVLEYPGSYPRQCHKSRTRRHAAADTLSTILTMRILHAVLVSSGIEDSLPGDIDLPKISPSTAAGICVAIAGNVLISLALNCQKLAHRRLERECEAAAHAPQPLLPTHADTHPPRSTRDERSIPTSSIPPSVALETVPLLERGQDLEPPPRKPWFFFRRSTTRIHAKEADRTHLASTHALVPVDDSTIRNGSSPHHKKSEKQPTEEANYLKSKLWYVSKSCRYHLSAHKNDRWLGFLLMNIGELGNFISYAFAPASLVAPLGTVRLHSTPHRRNKPRT